MKTLIGIYDFEFYPYALGDVLTWNVRTAMRCEEVGYHSVDIYICVDAKYPASIYQRGLINSQNFELFFYELYPAFGTHPNLGNIYIFRSREAMLTQLRSAIKKDPYNSEILHDYLKIINHSSSNITGKKFIKRIKNKLKHPLLMKYFKSIPKVFQEKIKDELLEEHALNSYFIKYIYSHKKINEYFKKRNHLPYLKPALGCAPDVEQFIASKLAKKKIVPFHLRLRRLDIGYGGDHSYERDSNFLEWYAFLKKCSLMYPEVQFIALGRLQEKPLELLRLPNVLSLRMFGMGLGHELTLMLKSDLFIGSSSGFAALANFSNLPYFITRMNPSSCDAYDIPQGENKLPFANLNQKLIYEDENASMLMHLLETGLQLPKKINKDIIQSKNSSIKDTATTESNYNYDMDINIPMWLKTHLNPHSEARTTTRFNFNAEYSKHETAYLLMQSLENARKEFIKLNFENAQNILLTIQDYFLTIWENFLPCILMKACMASIQNNLHELNFCLDKINKANVSSDCVDLLALLNDFLSAKNDNFTFSLSSNEKESNITNLLVDKLSQINFGKIA